MNFIQRFIAKIFRIKTGMIYNPETMGLPIKPGTILHNNFLFVKNDSSDITLYIAYGKNFSGKNGEELK